MAGDAELGREAYVAGPEPSHPVLLVPGIGGTMLHARRRGDTGPGERAWVTVRDADAQYQKLLGEYNGATGVLEPLDDSTEVLVPRSGRHASGLYPIAVLDPDAGYALRAVHYFDAFIAHLQGQGYTAGRDLFGFGYDFRQSCRAHAPRMLARLRRISRRSGGRRVDLVSHSMGGLVVLSFLSDFPREFEALAHSWVAVACPFGGAPGFVVDALLTGVQFAGSLGEYLWVSRETSRQACLQSPSTYELLPPLDFPHATPPPLLKLWLCGSTAPPAASCDCGTAPESGPQPSQSRGGPNGTLRHRQQEPPGAEASRMDAPAVGCCRPALRMFPYAALPKLLEEINADNTVCVGSQEVPLPFNPQAWEAGQQAHQAWRQAALPESVRFYSLYGTGLPTPYDCTYGAWWYPLHGLDAVRYANASFSTVDGDGTVTTESAVADGFKAAGRRALACEHRELVKSPEAWSQILAWLQEDDGGDGGDGWLLVNTATSP